MNFTPDGLPLVSPIGRRLHRLRPILLWILPLGFLGFFFFYPLGAIFKLAGQSLLSGSTVVDAETILRPLGFTFYQAALSMVLTLLVGLPAAYVFGRYLFAGKSILRALTTLPFILPTVVVAAAFNALLGPRGWLNLLLMNAFSLAEPPVQILNSLAAIVLAHVFYNTTVVIRTVGSAWAQLDPRLEQAARSLGASPFNVLREVTLPLLRPAILSAALLVFLFDFTSFGVVLLLGGPRFATLEVEIYTQAMYRLNLPLAGLLSAIQLGCTLLLTIIHGKLSGGRSIPLMPRLKGEGMRKPRRWSEHLLVGVVVITLLVLLIAPLGALVLRSFTRLEADRGQRGEVQTGLTLDYYRELFINRRESRFYVLPIQAAKNSLIYAGGTVGLALLMGFLAAQAQVHRSRLNTWVDPLLMLPLGASAVTLGLGFIVVFTRPPLDARSFPGLISIAHSLVALPFVVRTLQPALASIPVSLRQAAGVLGAPPWRVWLEVELPIIMRAVVASAIFAFTISLGEFGATSFLARPESPTLPVAIYRFLSQPGAMNYGQALAMASLLMLVCGASVFIIQRLEGEG